MKKKIFYVLISAMLLFAMAFPACSPMGQGEPKPKGVEASKGQSGQESDGTQAEAETDGMQAKGRYREEKLELPMPMKHIFAAFCKEGRIQILSEHAPGTFFLCESTDEGASWQRTEMNHHWLPEGYRVVSACFGAKGEIFVSAGKMSEIPIEEKNAVGEYSYFQLEASEGGFKASPLSLEAPAAEGEYDECGLGNLAASAEGKLYGLWNKRKGEEAECQVICFDLKEHGKAVWSVETKMAGIALVGESLYLDENEGFIKALDADFGEEGKEVPMRSADFLCMDSLSGQKLFYCNETGIYGTDESMAFTEQLVDGALSGFSDNRCTVRKLCCVNEKVFLVFLENGEGELEGLRYEYDPSLPTRPEQELEEKGILADFSRELEGWLEEGRVFPSVFEAFQREGAQNAVPISFSLPVAVGDKEQVQKIESLQDLGEAVGRTEGESPLAIHGFWPFAISVYWQGVQQEDGNAHRGEADVAAPVWDLVYGNAAMGLGCLGTIRDFAAISDHMPGQDMGCQVLGEGVFHALIAGVNGKSAQAELGKEFITFAIGEEEQRALNESLPASNQEFPVNQVVWKEITQKPSEDTMAEYGDIFVKLGGSFAWPGEEAFGQLEEEIAGLLHPMMEDWVVLDTVLEGAKAYSFVEKGLEDAVNGIVQKLEMYLAE